ncbi:lipoyl(octanoyl) transferase LipB [Gulosibacter chungangensis]|uniref:Octanoyltransferase n=1 Tax=Gulosibacter chungangensis TaxID=979746 RepID=A0A7J5BED2_9MICO|nr:lipoyl(octanoyl) transferase LipB [Gulosibacter chungangensis]KAB1643638.1 lipoyl(octanoyl) transferase LipB [Gulosibacter chungangensis]
MQLLNLLSEAPSKYLEIDVGHRELHAAVAAGQSPDTVIYTEFEPVYTAGSSTSDEDTPDKSVPIVRIDRGGSVTYHGPGQLVAYPIIHVHGRQDVVAYVRALEQAVIEMVAELGIATERVDGRSGVWLRTQGTPDRKLCAIGVRFAKRTTMHGLALNVRTDLRDFECVVPCGLRDAGVISLAELGIELTVAEAAELLHPHLERELARFRDPKEVATERAVAEAFTPTLLA